MKIRNVIHRGLRRFIEQGNPSGLTPQAVRKIQNVVTVLQEIDSLTELHDFPGWKIHPLTGDRKGTWSLTVTRNWRITFRFDKHEREIYDLDYEDYH
jgi:proteic killer suppression protein